MRPAKNWEEERKAMVERLVAEGYLKRPEVIEVMLRVPRHEFVPEPKRTFAYRDTPLEIGFGQTISAPHMVAMMTEALGVEGRNKILEVGAGSGYQAAILAELAKEGEVITIERIPELAEFARRNLERLGYRNVSVVVGDGTKGYAEEAPYDRIIVTAGAPHTPKALTEQLKDEGRLLIPVGSRWHQDLILVEKKRGQLLKRSLGGCVFVPLVGEDGWRC